MAFGIVFLATDVTIRDRNDQVNERIRRTLFKAIHIFYKGISVRARHDSEMGVYHTKRQMIHVLKR